MPKCTTCKKIIIFGGVREKNMRFCNKECQVNGVVHIQALQVSDIEAKILSLQIYDGICPLCKTNKGVEVHKSYQILSYIINTNYRTNIHVSCKSCAVKKQRIAFISSFFLGWWGIPFGITLTPVQLARNLFAMFSSTRSNEPSDELIEHAKMLIAEKELQSL